MNEILSITDLSIQYGSRTVIDRVGLQLSAGELLAVIGPNGAGKSTLIRAISGVIPTRAGLISIKNRDIRRLGIEERARLSAVVPQAVRLPEEFTVEQVVLMGRTPYLGWLAQPDESDRRAARAAMERTNTLSLGQRRIGELSGGEQQRVMVARALAQAPLVLLMDEPTAHLDLKYQADILGLILRLVREENLAVLVALHDLNLAALYADRVALLVDGCLRASGLPADVLTSDILTPAYGHPINVMIHPIYGTPLVLPDGR